MASVWKRLQRVNKRAAKFQYTASYHRVDLETSPKWKPNKLSVVWTRRSRRVITEPQQWEPSLKDPLKGSVIYTVPENHTVAVTLFKDSRTNELEDKDWTFVLEDVSTSGKRRRLAVCSINMRKYASLEPSQRPLALALEPATHKVVAAGLQLTLHCVLLREGQATDEDMQSLASLLSVNNNSDIAVLEDLDEDDYTLSDNSTKQMSDLRQQMEELTQSLTNSDIAATPNSVQSLNFDNSRTPTAPITPEDNTPTTPVNRDANQTPIPGIEAKMPEPVPFLSSTGKSRPEYLSNLTKLAMKSEQSKFTPKPLTIATQDIKTDLKAVVLKPKTIAKRNLKPLELKINLNNIILDNNDNEKEEDNDKTPTADSEKLFPSKLEKDKTPVQDLLEWCQSVTREYKSCRVTNLTTSFRSGLAFCAIIHRFRPDLIDFSGLQPEEGERNVRAALEASARLGIPQVLAAADVCGAAHPDRLAIMTYLFQLRAHFTGSELQVEQLGNSEAESSYLVGRHDTDGALPRELFSREVSARRSLRPVRSQDKSESVEKSSPSQSSGGSPARDISPPAPATAPAPAAAPAPAPATNTTWYTDVMPEPLRPPAARPPLMTRRELTDPFASDDEDDGRGPAAGRTLANENQTPSIEPATTDPLTALQSEAEKGENARTPPNAAEKKPSTAELPKPTPQLLSRHDELKERARLLLEATKREARERYKKQNSKDRDEGSKTEFVNGVSNGETPTSPKKAMTEEERQEMLRERARKLIADARAGIMSPSSPSRRPAPLEIISRQSVMDEIAAAGGVDQLEAMLRPRGLPLPAETRTTEDHGSEDSHSVKSGSADGEERGRSPLRSFSALVESLTPDKELPDEAGEKGSYIASEMEALEREQAAVDERAAALEKQLRAVMDASDDTEEEDRLMSQWFNLVNMKNALLRRQMQLNILEQEEDLSRRCELLARELRLSLAVDEWRKTPHQRRRERLLLQELVAAVNERDRLVQEMDEQERAIAEDDEIQRNLSQVEIQRKNNCILQ